MDGENGNRNEKVLVTFNGEIKVGKKRIPVAEHKGENDSEKVFLIPKGTLIPRKNELYLVLLPIDRYPSFYHSEKSVYPVKIIWPEMTEETKVFKNIFIPDPEFKKLSEGKIAVIIVGPKGEHKTFLLRIATNNGNREAVERFVKKNLLLEDVRVKESGIIEAIMELSEDRDYLENDFLKHLSDFVSKLSEA
jgi:hypothetical protein